MRFFFSLLTLTAFLPALRAATQTITVTPQTLAGWTVVGTDFRSLIPQTELTLPAGAQLARIFDSANLSLQFTSQPLLGENIADWPVLEIGHTALVFTRSGLMGKLSVVLGDQAPQELPFSFDLDDEGRSIAPLTLGFSREAAGVRIVTDNQSWSFPFKQSPESSLEIVLSAGATQPWSFSPLEVTVTSLDPVAPPAPAASLSVFTAFDPRDSIASQKGPEKKSVPVVSGPVPLPGSATVAGVVSLVVTAGTSARSTLEIFTPPPVRHGRAEVVRAVIQSSAKN